MPAGYNVRVYDPEGYTMSPRGVRPAFYHDVTQCATDYAEAVRNFSPVSPVVAEAREALAAASKALTDEIEAVRKHNLIIEKTQEFVKSLDVDSL
jgi:hypothetical protein